MNLNFTGFVTLSLLYRKPIQIIKSKPETKRLTNDLFLTSYKQQQRIKDKH